MSESTNRAKSAKILVNSQIVITWVQISKRRAASYA